MSTNPYEAPNTDLISEPQNSPLSRKALVPTWIKIFGWLFMVIGFLMPVLLLAGLVFDGPISLDFFGVKYSGPSRAITPVIMCGVGLFFGVSALGLLFGKKWGLDACLANGYLGVLICVFVMIVTKGASIRAELIVEFFYLRRLHKMRPQWNNSEHADTH